MLERNFFPISLVLLSSAISVWSQMKGYNRCEEGSIPCDDNFQCIRRSFWCDGDRDCRDGSDEIYCNRYWSRPRNCDANRHFTCKDKMCIPKVLKCDGINDCGDSSDEDQCDAEFAGNFNSSGDLLTTTESRDDFTDTDFPVTETMAYLVGTEMPETETVLYWELTEMPTTTPLPQNPSKHPVPGLGCKSTDKCFHENGPLRPNYNAGSVEQPGIDVFSSRESSPISPTSLDPRNPWALPRNYLDISINFPFAQRGRARDRPHLNDPRPSHNQGIERVPCWLRSGSSSDHFERSSGRFLADQQYQIARDADEEMSSRHALHRQSEDRPRSLVALFLLSDSSPINIRVNG